MSSWPEAQGSGSAWADSLADGLVKCMEGSVITISSVMISNVMFLTNKIH